MTMCECIGCEIVKIKDHMRGAVWNAHAAGFVVGISGGIDSAVACALAAKAVPIRRSRWETTDLPLPIPPVMPIL